MDRSLEWQIGVWKRERGSVFHLRETSRLIDTINILHCSSKLVGLWHTEMTESILILASSFGDTALLEIPSISALVGRIKNRPIRLRAWMTTIKSGCMVRNGVSSTGILMGI